MNTRERDELRKALATALVKIAKTEPRAIKSRQYKVLATVAIKSVYRNEETLS